MKYIDATGLVCPKPVILAKKALQEDNAITIDVDNAMSCENLQKMARVMGFSCEVCADGPVFHLVMSKTGEPYDKAADEKAMEAKDKKAAEAKDGPEHYTVVISSRYAGTGDDTLGDALMKSFIYTLTESEQLPECMIFYNGGVYLTCEGSPVLEDLQKLADAGVEIFSCGTCLNFYGLQEHLKVGQVTIMYAIVEKQLKAVRILRP